MDYESKENQTSLIRFKDETTKKKYKDIVESMIQNQYLLSISSSVLAEVKAHEEQGTPLPDILKMRYRTLIDEFPEMKEMYEPSDIAEMFRANAINNALELAILIIDATAKGAVEFSNIHDVLIPLIFSEEGGIDISEADVEELIDAVENISVHAIAEA